MPCGRISRASRRRACAVAAVATAASAAARALLTLPLPSSASHSATPKPAARSPVRRAKLRTRWRRVSRVLDVGLSDMAPPLAMRAQAPCGSLTNDFAVYFGKFDPPASSLVVGQLRSAEVVHTRVPRAIVLQQ